MAVVMDAHINLHLRAHHHVILIRELPNQMPTNEERRLVPGPTEQVSRSYMLASGQRNRLTQTTHLVHIHDFVSQCP